jgi:hypothetical protein
LTKAQKDDLFKTIRYSHLHHDELLKLSKNPIFESAKDYVMQGLSHRLNPFEEVPENDEKYTIELKPRISYAEKVLKSTQSIAAKKKEEVDEDKKEDTASKSQVTGQANGVKAKNLE